MKTITTLEKEAPFIVRGGPITVALVGCGGTGSHIAQALARLAAHLRARREDLRLIFVDGDQVEERNVGRQLFTPGDIGHNKAQVLAARFNRMFGLGIEALDEMATVDRLAAIGGISRKHGGVRQESLGLLIGAVDTATARRSLHGALRQQPCWSLWLDCGNHEDAGQILVGGEADPSKLSGAVQMGICTRLPAPSLTAPDLLAATERKRRADCAAAMEDNAQSLEVNQVMAAFAARYINDIVIRRRLTRFQTEIDLPTLTARSTSITASAIQAVQRRAQQHRALLEEVEGILQEVAVPVAA